MPNLKAVGPYRGVFRLSGATGGESDHPRDEVYDDLSNSVGHDYAARKIEGSARRAGRGDGTSSY